MHIIFLNPQGNFDSLNSHMIAHPDFGGQLIYVRELAHAMAELGHKVDIITRRITEKKWSEFSEQIDYYDSFRDRLRIIRIECGGLDFLPKEKLWPHLEEFTDNIIKFYKDDLPDFATAHYADGGFCAALLQDKTGINFSFTGHSLGAQKLDKLQMTLKNADKLNKKFKFTQRINAERLSIERSFKTVTSTKQERDTQYFHPLYKDTVKKKKFRVIPPGVNPRVFYPPDKNTEAQLPVAKLREHDKPAIILASRMDEKKNMIGVVRVYAQNKELHKKTNLVIFQREIEDPFKDGDKLAKSERKILKQILKTLTDAGLEKQVFFMNLDNQVEIAKVYRYLATKGSVFILASFYEPFGLGPIEAAACGLACVATKNGGPTEVFADGSGILVDPFSDNEIKEGLIKALNNFKYFSKKSQKNVHKNYLWNNTAEQYLKIVESGLKKANTKNQSKISLSDTTVLTKYLKSKNQ